MATQRKRAIVTAETRPFLPRHVRLRFSDVRIAWAVLAPERVLWPDEISLEILRRCDGETSAAEIAADLCSRYDAPRAEVEADVQAFLQDWADELLIRVQE